MKTYTLFHSFKLTLVLLTLSLTVGISNAWGATYTLVTNTNQLSAGDEIIIANATEGKAIGTTQNTNNRAAVSVTITNDKISNPGNKVQIITLETSSTNWKFKVGTDSYLYAASNTSNHLKSSTATTAGANGVWSISISSSNATISATGTNSHNKLKYNANNGNPIFSCYTTGENLRIYKKVSGYSITYHCNGATLDCPSNASGQTALPNPLPTPTRTGCTFAGWYTNEGFTTAATAGATLAADADLYAKWTCNVTLNRNGATETINNVVVGTALDDIDGASAQGGCSEWTFEGWSKTQRAAQNNSTAMDLVTTVDGPGPYYAVYSHTESGGGNSTASSNNISSTSTNAVTLETGNPITYKCSTSNEYSNPARIYKNNTITIAGATITSISLTGVSDYAISNMTVNTGTLSTSGDNGTWEGSATSIVFTASSAQTRISVITVTYTGGSTTYYSTTASCCTALGQINGSINWSNGQATVSWDAAAGCSSWTLKYKEHVASDISANWTTYGGAFGTAAGRTSNSTAISGLTAGTEYDFKITGSSDGTTYCAGEVGETTSSTVPQIIASRDLTGSDYAYNDGPGTVKTFDVSGVGLVAGSLTFSVPTSPAQLFEISTDNGDSWGSSKTLAISAGTLSATTIKVRLKAGLSIDSYGPHTITISGGGAANNTGVTIAGSVTPACTKPTVATPTLTSIASGTITVSCASVTVDENCDVTEYGFVWNESSDPTISDNKTPVGSSTPASGFNDNLSISFTTSTTYKIKAYAINSAGTTLSATLSFTPRSVTFNSNGGSAVATAYVNSGSTVSEPSAPERTGYDFVKWQLNETDYSFSSAVNENITLDANWTPHNFTITYEGLAGAINTNPTSYTIETATINLADPGSRTGYTFSGWTLGGSPITQIVLGTTGNKTITATWSINTPNLAVNAADHVVITATPASESAIAEGANRNVNYNKTVTLNCTPDAHYSLVWDVYKTGESSTKVAVTGSGDGATFTMPDYNVTVSAVMTEAAYKTVCFKNNGEDIDGYASVKVYVGESPSAPTLTDGTSGDACDPTSDKHYGWTKETWTSTIATQSEIDARTGTEAVYAKSAALPVVAAEDPATIIYHAVWAAGSGSPAITPPTPIVYWERQSIAADKDISATTGTGTLRSNAAFTADTYIKVYNCTSLPSTPTVTLSGLNMSGAIGSTVAISFYTRGTNASAGTLTVKYTNGGVESTAGTVDVANGLIRYHEVNGIPKTATQIKLEHSKSSGNLAIGTIRIFEVNTTEYTFSELDETNTDGWTNNDWDGYYLITNASTYALDGNGIGEKNFATVSPSDNKIVTTNIGAAFDVTYVVSENGYKLQGVGSGDYLNTASNSVAPSASVIYHSSMSYNSVVDNSSNTLKWNSSKFGFYASAGTAIKLYKILASYSTFLTTCCTQYEISGASTSGTVVSGGTLTSTYNSSCEGNDVKITATVNTGYRFDGWDITSGGSTVARKDGSAETEGGNPIYIFTMPSAAVTISADIAKWTTTVTLDANEGTGTAQTVTATYGDAMPLETTSDVAIAVPTKTGAKLLGYWDTDASSGGTQYYAYGGSTLSSARAWDKEVGDVTLYARWMTVDYYIDDMHRTEYYTGAGMEMSGAGYEVPGPFADSKAGNVCETEHYIFVGWVSADEQNTDGTLKGTPTIVQPGEVKNASGTTYYAVWAEE